jgi:acyl-CoA synthetase (AMP-forming)/AMP-acid ligase II
MDGYLGDPEATARALRDGWLDTGDLGFLREGELYLTGRAKDVVILRGRNYAPDEIERSVEAVPGVRSGCAVAASWLPEDAPGEVLALFVEASRAATAVEREALPEACRAAVLGATGLAVDRVVILAPGTLPRTSSGKLRRAETLRLYLAEELTAPDPVTPLRLAGAMARSSLAYAKMRFERREG